MDIYQHKTGIKWVMAVLGLSVIVGTLLYTDYLAKRLVERESKLIHLYARALENAAKNVGTDNDMTFLMEEIIQANVSIPVILADEKGNPISDKNVEYPKEWKESTRIEFLKTQIREMSEQHPPIKVEFYGIVNFIYYKNSSLLTLLRYYPYVQLGAIMLLIVVGYAAFSYSRKSEQNRVWVGLAKETAHQLGTPLSSLMAISEYFKEEASTRSNPMVSELAKDVERLEIITQRFAQIGLEGKLESVVVRDILEPQIRYLQARTSNKIEYSFQDTTNGARAKLNASLIGWVIENICKNAIDAMEGKGKLRLVLQSEGHQVFLDITDTGKGMNKKTIQSIFKPGYTTKKRGWGLGLTLVKRIMEEYHQGKVVVLKSEPGVGTTFRLSWTKVIG